MPQARRFAELEVEGASRPLPETRPIDTDVRIPRNDRDLAIGTSSDSAAEPQPPARPAAE